MTQQKLDLIILGDSSVGKTSLLNAFKGKKEQSMATMGLDIV